MANSIKPNKGDTLGSLMSSQFSAADPTAEPADPINPAAQLTDEQQDSYSATFAYAPGWPAQLLEGTDAQPRSDFTSNVCNGLHDLAMPSLLALAERAHNLTQLNNRYSTATVPSDPVGLRRGTHLLTGKGAKVPYAQLGQQMTQDDTGNELPLAAGSNEAVTYAAKSGFSGLDDTTAANLNFESLSGGVEAGTLGSFFKSEQLQDILTKVGNPIGAETDTPHDGHTLLKRLENPEGVRPIEDAVQSVLDDINRFSPSVPPEQGGADESDSPYLKGASGEYPFSHSNPDARLCSRLRKSIASQGTVERPDGSRSFRKVRS